MALAPRTASIPAEVSDEAWAPWCPPHPGARERSPSPPLPSAHSSAVSEGLLHPNPLTRLANAHILAPGLRLDAPMARCLVHRGGTEAGRAGHQYLRGGAARGRAPPRTAATSLDGGAERHPDAPIPVAGAESEVTARGPSELSTHRLGYSHVGRCPCLPCSRRASGGLSIDERDDGARSGPGVTLHIEMIYQQPPDRSNPVVTPRPVGNGTIPKAKPDTVTIYRDGQHGGRSRVPNRR